MSGTDGQQSAQFSNGESFLVDSEPGVVHLSSGCRAGLV